MTIALLTSRPIVVIDIEAERQTRSAGSPAGEATMTRRPVDRRAFARRRTQVAQQHPDDPDEEQVEEPEEEQPDGPEDEQEAVHQVGRLGDLDHEDASAEPDPVADAQHDLAHAGAVDARCRWCCRGP